MGEEEELGPRQRAAETKRRRTREAIVNGTIDLYGEQQRGDFTLDQIAEEAGVSAATIANHFGSKYEVLKAAYERLLSPLVDTIVEADKAGVYQPKDGIDELVRYVYGVARLSHEHRALTAAMVKAYFELPPGGWHDTGVKGFETLLEDRVPLGDYLAEGMYPIFKHPPLRAEMFSPKGMSPDYWTLLPAADEILLAVYRSPEETVPEDVTFRVCRLLLNAIIHEDHNQDLRERMKRVAKPS